MKRVSIVRVPRLPSRGSVRRFARRGASAVASAAKDEKHTITAALAAAAYGYAERPGKEDGKSITSKLPRIPGLGTAGTAAAAAFVASKTVFKGNRTARHVATGLIAVAAYKAGRGDDMSSGDDEASGSY